MSEIVERKKKLRAAEAMVKEALRMLDFPLGEDGLDSTPKRVVKYWNSMLDPEEKEEFQWTVFPARSRNIVIVKDINFASACSHHLLPFYGRAHVGYIPAVDENNKIVGLSKLARVVKYFAKNFTTQEYMTEEIGQTLMNELKTEDVAVSVDAVHTCMSCRGVESINAQTGTKFMSGVFMDEPSAKEEFMNYIKG